jgi:hypothetical protein
MKLKTSGFSLRLLIKRFGFSSAAWNDAIKRGDIKNENKYIFIKQSLECGKCGISEWLGQKIQLRFDHINDITNDNRKENLQFLRPNCYSLKHRVRSPKRLKLS